MHFDVELRAETARLNARGVRGKLIRSRPPLGFPSGFAFSGSWRNWQTRKVEGLVPARACWFNSSRAQLEVKSRESRVKSQKRSGSRLLTLSSRLY